MQVKYNATVDLYMNTFPRVKRGDR